MDCPASPALGRSYGQNPETWNHHSEAQDTAHSFRLGGTMHGGPTLLETWWVQGCVREARSQGSWEYTYVHQLTSVRGACGLYLVSRNVSHKRQSKALQLDVQLFEKFPAWLQTSRGSESPVADDLISTISQPFGRRPTQPIGGRG